MRQLHDGDTNSAEPEVDSILFARSSLYTVIGLLTLAVLFCAGVLAYTVRRNDVLKTEYYRLMVAVAERGSKGATRSTFEPDFPPESVETMGPGPKVEEATRDAVMLLVTRKPISNVSHPNRTRRTTTASMATRAVYYDDLDSGPRRKRPRMAANKVVRNNTVARTSSSLDALGKALLTARLTTFEESLKETAPPQVLKASPAVAATNVTEAEAIVLTPEYAVSDTDANDNTTLSEADYYAIDSSTEGPEGDV